MRLVSRTVLGGFCLLLSACSGSAATATPSRAPMTPSSSASSNVATACASVHTTTPIDKVPPACAALWRPYLVTMVPPPDELQQERLPATPNVTNMTNGAVSQTDAQHWADANSKASGWYKWAEANGQRFLLPKLAGPALISSVEEQALEQGATIADPDCSLFPGALTLYPVGADGKAYFGRKNLPTDANFVFVASYTGPCVITAKFPDGHSQTISELSQSELGFIPGEFRHDQLLGDIWYTDAGGNCNDPAGPPPEWCGR